MMIKTRSMREAEFELSYQIKKEALGLYVAKRWGWDDDLQRRIHREHWETRNFLAICVDAIVVGTVCNEAALDHWRFGEFFILPEYQNRGIGSQVLEEAISDADSTQLPMRLEYLKWNPVGTLYKRHGFRQISENDTHYFMERPPSGMDSARATLSDRP